MSPASRVSADENGAGGVMHDAVADAAHEGPADGVEAT